MNNLFSPEYEKFRLKVREFVVHQLRPYASQWESSGEFPRNIMKECALRGYLQDDPRLNAILAEELPCSESLGFALSFFVQANLIIPLIQEFGSPAQRAFYLPQLEAGETIGAMAVTEPGAGSDLAALSCVGEISGDGLAVRGEKTYITNAAFADLLIVAVRLADQPEGLTMVLVPVKTEGVAVERVQTLGLNASGTARLRFDGCRVPRENVLGAIGEGFVQVQRGLNRERLFGGFACVAWAQYALNKALEFTRERKAFGQTLSRFQAIRHEFAEMATLLEAARSLNYRTFTRWAAGESVTREICMIKLFSYQAAQQVITFCLQVHGGLGYMADHWSSRFYRDARALTIAAGTPEIMKDMIATYERV
jgi:citronellyl-CoA dehydrogenase